jgi:hypothetical protein
MICARWFTGRSQPVRRRVLTHNNQWATVPFKARAHISRGIDIPQSVFCPWGHWYPHDNIILTNPVYCAVLKRLKTPSDFHTPLPSIVPFAHSETFFTHGCYYSIFPGSSGTTSVFPSFRFPVDHNFWKSRTEDLTITNAFGPVRFEIVEHNVLCKESCVLWRRLVLRTSDICYCSEV